MLVIQLIALLEVDNDYEIDFYDKTVDGGLYETVTFSDLFQGRVDTPWLDARIVYVNPDTDGRYMQIAAKLPKSR